MQQLILHVIPLYFVVYVYYRLIKHLPTQWGIHRFFVLILLCGAQYVALARYNLYGYADKLPFAAWSVWSFLYDSFVLLCILTLFLDFAGLFFHLRKKSWPIKREYIAGLTVVLGFGLGFIGHHEALRQPPVKAFNVYIDNLPSEFDGFTIAQLSDVHISALFDQTAVQDLVTRTNQLNADMIVVTGDLLDGNFAKLQANVEPLTKLHAKEGVYVVEGNHEHYYDYERWIEYFKQQPWVFLQNQSATIVRGQAQMSIIGLTDPMAKRYHREEPNIDKALSNVSSDNIKILLSHQVKQTQQWSHRGIHLQLSGHTHGGQILGINLLAAYLNNGFVNGLYRVGSLQLYVNPGAFLWYGSPVRLGVPSEITLITLSAVKPQ